MKKNVLIFGFMMQGAITQLPYSVILAQTLFWEYFYGHQFTQVILNVHTIGIAVGSFLVEHVSNCLGEYGCCYIYYLASFINMTAISFYRHISNDIIRMIVTLSTFFPFSMLIMVYMTTVTTFAADKIGRAHV